MDKICIFNFFSLSLPPEHVNFIKKEIETLHLIIYSIVEAQREIKNSKLFYNFRNNNN